MEPTRLLTIIALLSLVTVEYGGWALLGFFTGRGSLGGILAQSGGFFLHLAVGHEGQRSPGTIMTRPEHCSSRSPCSSWPPGCSPPAEGETRPSGPGDVEDPLAAPTIW